MNINFYAKKKLLKLAVREFALFNLQNIEKAMREKIFRYVFLWAFATKQLTLLKQKLVKFECTLQMAKRLF